MKKILKRINDSHSLLQKIENKGEKVTIERKETVERNKRNTPASKTQIKQLRKL